MSLIPNGLAKSAAGGGAPSLYDYTIDGSLRADDGGSANYMLQFNPASNGNRKTWTLSLWAKCGKVDSSDHWIGSAYDGSANNQCAFRWSGQGIEFWTGGYAGEPQGVWGTTAKFRDPSAWYHIVFILNTPASNGDDRMQIWVNGERQAGSYKYFGTVGQNYDGMWNESGSPMSLGSYYNFGGNLAEIHMIDGQALDSSYFGETKSGVWVPKEYTGSYGTNGFYLDFATSLTADQSGNGNNFTVYNNLLQNHDLVLDSPTNNFATLNPLSNFQGATISEGNLKAVGSASDKRYSSTLGMNSGKWYWEVDISTVGNRNGVGVFSEDNTTVTTLPSDYAYLQVGNSADFTSGTDNYAQPSWSAGDILTIAFDADNGKVFYGKNSAPTVSGSGDHYGLSTSVTYLAGCRETGATVGTNIYNFGQDSSFAGNKTAQGNTDDNGYGDFYYAPPTGYLALCTANLTVPDAMNPALDNSPQDYFNTVLYTGNNSATNAITGVGFAPDLVWLKARNVGQSHYLGDTVRGNDGFLYSDATSAETAATDWIDYDSDGFTLNAVYANTSTYNYVGWNWKANGSGVSNTDGSITSTVSANTDAGFSIVSFTGTGANATVGHGLSSAPEWVIFKNRDSGYSWGTYVKSVGAGNRMLLESTQAVQASSTSFNSTDPTSSVFSVGTNVSTNQSGADIIAYAFHSVEGFSKFGSYTGNDNPDGPFIYTGFRPAFVMIKNTSTVQPWVIIDNTRSEYNVSANKLYPNASDAENSTSTDNSLDILSNGFKLRGDTASNDSTNGPSNTLIYMAFAENPFKYSTAR